MKPHLLGEWKFLAVTARRFNTSSYPDQDARIEYHLSENKTVYQPLISPGSYRSMETKFQEFSRDRENPRTQVYFVIDHENYIDIQDNVNIYFTYVHSCYFISKQGLPDIIST